MNKWLYSSAVGKVLKVFCNDEWFSGVGSGWKKQYVCFLDKLLQVIVLAIMKHSEESF